MKLQHVISGLLVSFSLAASVRGELVAKFDFEGGAATELQDSTGNFGDLGLRGNATIVDGKLDVNGSGTTASGWAASGGYSGPQIGSKTLVSWVTLQSLTGVARAGSALTLDTQVGDQFDGIIFAERDTDRWMNGSNNFSRTPAAQFNGDPAAVETTTGEQIRMAITYEDIGGGNVVITGYRNDTMIGQYTDNPLAIWNAGNAEIILGKRHGDPNASGPGALDALIEEVRIYNTALSPAEISQLQLIPEPSTLVLAAIGLLGLGMARRRRAAR